MQHARRVRFAVLALLCGRLCLPATVRAAADEPRVLVEVERTQIFEGESVLYRVTIQNVQDPSPPKLDGFDDFAIQDRGSQSLNSSQITIINGRRSESVTFGHAYQYQLTPKRTGDLTVPAPTVEIDGRTLRGRTLKLRVNPPQEQDTVLLEILFDPPAVYPSQTFAVVLNVAVKELPEPYTKRDPLSVLPRAPALSVPWATDDNLPAAVTPESNWQTWITKYLNRRDSGFSINNISSGSAFSLFDDGPSKFLPPSKRTQRKTKAGQLQGYWEYPFSRSFTATRVGSVPFGPVTLKGTLATSLTQGDQLDGEKFFAVAKPATLVIKDVPQDGRPETYSGVIGEFEFNARLVPAAAKVGDPLTLTLTLRGRGTLDAVKAPDLSQLAELAGRFKFHEATEDSGDGERRFTYSVRPLEVGSLQFPSVPFTYFDVKREKFVTLQTEPIAVEVTRAEQLSSSQIAMALPSQPGGTEIETREGGILANDSALTSLRDDGVHPPQWFGGLGILAGVYGVVVLVGRRWERLSGDPLLRRRRSAVPRARQRLAEASRSDTRQVADALQAALVGLVADAAGIPEAGLTSAEVRQRLLQMELAAPLIERLSAWFETCDAARYGASPQAGPGLEATATQLLDDLVQALRGKRLLN